MQYAGVPTSGSCPSGTVSAPITSTRYNQTKKIMLLLDIELD